MQRRRVWMAGGLLAAALMWASGCATVQPAAPERLAAPATAASGPIAWPARDPACFEHPIWRAALEQSKDRLVVTATEERGGKLEISRRAFPITRLSATRMGVGMLTEFDLRISEPKPEPARRFAFFSSRTPVVSVFNMPAGLFTTPGAEHRPVEGSTVLVPIEMDWPFGAVDQEPKPKPAPASDVPGRTVTRASVYPGDATIVRVWPRAPGVAFRGYVVALRPIAGRAYTVSTLRRLSEEGWQVVESGLNLGRRFSGELSDAATETDVATVGKATATEVDESLAELAYGVEAVLQRLDADRGGTGKPPVLMVGFSGGALATPTVAARLDTRVVGAVIVGGGVDICRIMQTSTLADYGLALKRGGKIIGGEDFERLNKVYLDATALDPVKTAPALSRVPVLMLHAAEDQIVPVQTGERLYELLRRPERWVFDIGHELMFWRLSGYSGDIARWVREHVPAGPG